VALTAGDGVLVLALVDEPLVVCVALGPLCRAVVAPGEVVVVRVVTVVTVVDVLVAWPAVFWWDEPPKNVVWFLLPVIECPAIASDTVKTTSTIANANRPVPTASHHRRCDLYVSI